jgi:hypothetical protein
MYPLICLSKIFYGFPVTFHFSRGFVPEVENTSTAGPPWKACLNINILAIFKFKNYDVEVNQNK